MDRFADPMVVVVSVSDWTRKAAASDAVVAAAVFATVFMDVAAAVADVFIDAAAVVVAAVVDPRARDTGRWSSVSVPAWQD